RLRVPAGDVLRAGQQVPGPLGAGQDAGAGRPGLLREGTMNTAHRLIAEAATRLAGEMPAANVEALACAVLSEPVTKAQVVQGIPHLHYRSLAAAVLDLLQTQAPDVPAEAVALALREALAA